MLTEDKTHDVQKSSWRKRWFAIVSLPIVAILWALSSAIFWIIDLFYCWWGVQCLDLDITRRTLQWVFGVIALIAIPLTIFGVIKVSKSQTLLGRAFTSWWNLSKKTVKYWSAFLAIFIVLIWWQAFVSNTYFMQPWASIMEEMFQDALRQDLSSNELREVADVFWVPYEIVRQENAEWVLVEEFVFDFTQFPAQFEIIPWQEIPYYILEIVWILLSFFFGLMILSGALSAVYTSSVESKSFTAYLSWKKILSYIIGMILYMLTILIGFILLIVPGILAIFRWKLFAYAILQEWLWPIDALKKSRSLTKGHFWDMVWLSVLQWMYAVWWFLMLIVWALWTIPAWRMAEAKVYMLLKNWLDWNNHDDTDNTMPYSNELMQQQ